MVLVVPIITYKERQKILGKYELDTKDIRILERKGINAARNIIREIQGEYKQYEFNGLSVYTTCYIEWKNKKAPAVTDAKNETISQ